MPTEIAKLITQQFDELLQNRQQDLFTEGRLSQTSVTHGDLSRILEALIQAIGVEVEILAKPGAEHAPFVPQGCAFCGVFLRDDSEHDCTSEVLKARVTLLTQNLESYRSVFHQQEQKVSSLRRLYERAEKEIAFQKERRRTEREGLVAWLDKRIQQQQEALTASYIGTETKSIIETEVSLLKKYRLIIVEGLHRVEDPTILLTFKED